LFLEVLI